LMIRKMLTVALQTSHRCCNNLPNNH